MTESFVSWRRPALSTLIPGDLQPDDARLVDGRIPANLPLVLTDEQGDVTVPVTFVLTGPQDVLRVNTEAIVTRRPTPGSTNVEITHTPYIELAEADLPWRYSPQPNSPTGIQPWLVLLVGESGTELTVGNGEVQVTGSALDEHPLNLSASWAHVHQIPGHADIARVLAPRVVTDAGGAIVSALRQSADYTVALVPAWLPGPRPTDPPRPAWSTSGNTTTTLPCFDNWNFRTTDEDDDFKKIAERLHALTTAEEQAVAHEKVGLASIGLGPVGPGHLDLGGAITVPSGPADSPLKPGTATATSRLARFQRTAQGRWLLGLPRYDEPWASPPSADPAPARLHGWRKQLHNDPRHRGVAGLGAWAGIAWQDRIADAAAAQAGAIALAAERIRSLTLGLQATRYHWRRRVPDNPQQAVAVLAPMLRRLPTADSTTAMEALSDRTAWLRPALFSSAARRMLRPRGPVARVAKPGSRRLPRLAATAATNCPNPPRPPVGQRDLIVDSDTARQASERLRDNAQAFVSEAFTAINEQDKTHPFTDFKPLILNPNIPPSTGIDGVVGPGGDGTGTSDGTGTHDGVADPDRDHLAGRLSEVPEEIIDTLVRAAQPVSRCRPLEPSGWTAAATSVVKGIDPLVKRPVVVDRVLDGITGLREPVLAPPDFAPELDIPLWSFLRDNARDWLLPGGGKVPQDRVLAMATNQEFVDAFMIGVNQQTLAELRRRNIPVTSGWTPLRRFWQRIDAAGVATDIQPVLDLLTEPAPGRPRWPEGSPLGAHTHQRDDASSQLVILLHTELFRRYPTTQVYLVENPGGTSDWTTVPEVGDPATHIQPILSGVVEPELTFFGFPMTPQDGERFWLVLEEPPPGYRFRAPTGPQRELKNGGAYAAATLDPPVRAFFGNLL
jgi:hypothetical protein